jgi:hypothetical protein
MGRAEKDTWVATAADFEALVYECGPRGAVLLNCDAYIQTYISSLGPWPLALTALPFLFHRITALKSGASLNRFPIIALNLVLGTHLACHAFSIQGLAFAHGAKW